MITFQFGPTSFAWEDYDANHPVVATLRQLKTNFPELQIIPKSESLFRRIVYWTLLILTFGLFKDTKFTTCAKNRIYLSDSDARLFKAYLPSIIHMVLRHEEVHLGQIAYYGRVEFYLRYLGFPLPVFFAWTRAMIEKPAYQAEMKAAWECRRDVTSDNYKEQWISKFYGKTYAYMWRHTKTVEKWYEEGLRAITSG